MITIELPDEGPLYLALWRSRKVEEPLPKAAVRALEERFHLRPVRPNDKPLLTWVGVLDV